MEEGQPGIIANVHGEYPAGAQELTQLGVVVGVGKVDGRIHARKNIKNNGVEPAKNTAVGCDMTTEKRGNLGEHGAHIRNHELAPGTCG